MAPSQEHPYRSSLDLHETISDMYRTDTFRKKFGNVVTHQLVEATTEASTELRDKSRNERGHLTTEGLKYDVLAQLSDAVSAEQELSDEPRGYIPDHRFRTLKEKLSHFNESLKAWVDSDPKLPFNGVITYLGAYYRAQQAQSLAAMNPREMKRHLDWVRNDLTERLHGMRNEIGFEQMLGHMEVAGYPIEYDNGSSQQAVRTSEDLHGNDLFVTLNKARFGVDVKASPINEDISRQHAILDGHNPHTILWSQLEWEDFDGGFRLPLAIVQDKKKMDAIYRKLQEARNSFSKGQVEVLSR